MSKRLTKDDLPTTFGAFKPVDHVVVAIPPGMSSADVAGAFRTEGFDDADLLYFSPSEDLARLDEMRDDASGVSGFGWEVVLMDRYRKLSKLGHQWLVVHAPDAGATERVKMVAERFKAPMAVKYHRLVVEDLI